MKKYRFNNGADKFSEEVVRLTDVRPSAAQLEYHKLGYYSFIHYGMNTFTGKEWGTGKELPSKFAPEKVDTDQWVRVLKESGSKMIIFTAKHHDGFCLFQTQYTEHSIKNSPYMDGKGDIVRQLADSCRKYDVKLGIYLSPWDRHDTRYGTEEYNDYFANQLTELCTNYGEIACFWFDGAKGKDAPEFTYDFERFYGIIRNLQPEAIISNCGPDVRWIGNEAGKGRKSEWNVVPRDLIYACANPAKKNRRNPKVLSAVNEDLGSRAVLRNYGDLAWYPAEADVSIHKGWFYSKHPKRKSAGELFKIYLNTVGANASLLINVPPSKNGIIEEEDVEILKDFKNRVDRLTKKKIEYRIKRETLALNENENEYEFILDKPQYVNTIVLSEDLTKGQRVESYEIYSYRFRKYKKVAEGTVIGSKRIIRLDYTWSKKLKLVFKQSRGCPCMDTMEIYS